MMMMCVCVVRYNRQVDVVCRGFSGYNSRWALDVLRGLLTPTHTLTHSHTHTDTYSMATIFFGANDAVTSDDLQHCPLDKYRSNITSMVEALRVHNPTIHIILITPGTVDHSLWPTRSEDQVAQYASVVREVGVALNVPVADLWSGAFALDKAVDFSDGLHLSTSGNEKVYNVVMSVINKYFKDSIPECTHYPAWRELAGRPASDTRAIIEQWQWEESK
jgi:lysophospholipase L1-like esterase